MKSNKNICGLSDDTIIEILSDIESKVQYSVIAEKYSIGMTSVHRIASEYGLVKYRRPSKSITKELVENIYNDYGNKEKVNDIIKKYEISKTSYYRIIKGEYDYLLNNETDEANNQEITDIESANETSDVEITDINKNNYDTAIKNTHKTNDTTGIDIDKNNCTTIENVYIAKDIADNLNIIKTNKPVLECGLVSERHYMPINTYVFNKSLNYQIMFNYDYIDNVCRDFIRKHIIFDEYGNASKDINLYVTGIQCVLASFIKICEEMKVNLSLYHYNSNNKKYIKQVIWDKFGEQYTYPSEFAELLDKSKESFSYKCNINDAAKNDKVYLITAEFYIRNSRKIDYTNTVIALNINDAFDLYYNHIRVMQHIDINTTMYIHECKKENNRFIKSNSCIIRTSNF